MHSGIVVVRSPGHPAADRGLPRLLAAYHLRTESEKGAAVESVDELPERYRSEVQHPSATFANDVVLVAMNGDAAVGCLVVTASKNGTSEIKRLWTDPEFRGRGIASKLIEAAFAHAQESGISTVRLSVWEWRHDAIGLYERLGFAAVDSWEEREQLVCMERSTAPDVPSRPAA